MSIAATERQKGEKIMVVIINFSHPLNAEAERILREEYSAGEAVIHKITVQLDFSEPIETQLEAIVENVLALPEVRGNRWNVDCIIPPGHGLAAAYIGRRFPGANIVVMAMRGIVPQYFPIGLVRPNR